MALTTRCPQCGTSFKVVPDQLRVRNGLVRCGACSTVFDGRACLLPDAGAPATPPA
ncbi:MJ0042-type zinc finger domain-containing protein, partial [Achromobacter marplatensis]|uniref:MJ0042-type zinc finger domain-containing protein n=1 Tax=Achromobacter marplatensis TaxID=470868 RepID=UPI0028E48515